MNQIIKFGDYVLQPADVVVVRRVEYNIFDHYLVYMGDGLFTAKMQSGIVTMSIEDLQQFIGIYQAVRMRVFVGNEAQRQLALFRANQLLAIHHPYSLLFSNCEHFADYVQFGTFTSLQSAKAGVGLIGLGALMTSQSKNEAAQIFGGLSIFAGVLALINETLGENPAPVNPLPYKKY